MKFLQYPDDLASPLLLIRLQQPQRVQFEMLTYGPSIHSCGKEKAQTLV